MNLKKKYVWEPCKKNTNRTNRTNRAQFNIYKKIINFQSIDGIDVEKNINKK
jgi:hypothetical protein